MSDQLNEFVKMLENRQTGWVARRDAAEALGKMAQQAVHSLTAHHDDPDMDVQMAVDRSLKPLQVMLSSRPGSLRAYTLKDLAFACEKRGVRTVETWESGFQITVRLREKRVQKVYLMSHDSRDGRRLVRIYTHCGPATEEACKWALRANAKITHAAFALLHRDGEEHLVLVKNILKEEATRELVKRTVKEMAYYGDWLEEKLGGLDEF